MGQSSYSSSTQVASSVPFDNSTNGFTSTDVQSAIEESTHHLTTGTVSSTTTITTTSSTDVLATSMTLTPVSGTYFVIFDTTVQSTAGGNSITVSIYSGGVQIANSSRVVQFPTATLISSGNPTFIGTHSMGVTVNGAQAITIEWHTNGGTATMLNRTLSLMRIG